MQEVQETKNSIRSGLRDRKRSDTHARIQAEGVRLFLERGFDVTTLDDIAAAAAVSRRSLFHYFASKEEILFSTKADFPDLIADAVSRRPRDEPLLDMVENALTDMATHYQSARSCELAKLIHSTPSLSAADWARYGDVERALAKALASRKGVADTDIACRVIAATAASILKLSTDAWLAGGGPGPEVYGRAAFTALRGVVGQSMPRLDPASGSG